MAFEKYRLLTSLSFLFSGSFIFISLSNLIKIFDICGNIGIPSFNIRYVFKTFEEKVFIF